MTIAISAYELVQTTSCSEAACTEDADGDDGLCRIHRAQLEARKRPRPVPRLDDRLGLRTDGLDREGWEQLLQRVAAVDCARLWWIGDLLEFGGLDETTKYERAEELLGKPRDRLYHLALTARAIPRHRRRKELHHTHHATVQHLPDDEQDAWLQRAIDEQLGVRQLREALNAAGERDGRLSHNDVRPQRLNRSVVLVARKRTGVALYFTPEQAARVQAVCEERRWSLSRLVREALVAYIG